MAHARPWYKRNGAALVMAAMHMPSSDHKWAYSCIIDMLNDRDARLPDDAGFICGFTGLSKRMWKAVREFLLNDLDSNGEPRLIEIDGYLTNPRFERELAERRGMVEQAREYGRQGGKKSAAIRNSQGPNQGEIDFSDAKSTRKDEISASFRQDNLEINEQKSQNSAPQFQPPPQPIRAREESRDKSIEPTEQTAARARAPARDSADQPKSQAPDDLLARISEATGFFPSSPEAIAQAHGYLSRWIALGVDFDAMAIPLMAKMIANSREAITSSLARFDRAILAQNAKDKAKDRSRPKPKQAPIPVYQFDDEDARIIPFRQAILRIIGPHAYARFSEISPSQRCRNIKIRIAEHANGGDIVAIDGPLSNELRDKAGTLNLRKAAQALGFVDCF